MGCYHPDVPMQLPPAGWYPDPGDSSYLRYWDGTAWTAHWAPTGGPGPAYRTGRSGSPTGKQLLRASFALFRQNRRMFWLPVLSGVISAAAFLLISGLIAVPLIRSYGWSGWGALYFVPGGMAANFIAVFFNVALAFAANEQIEGRSIDIPSALRMAWQRRRVVFSWALVTTTVGMVLRAIENRLGIFGRLAAILGGVTWAVANFMVIPVLAFEDLGPIAALKQSSRLIKQRFGTIARGALRFGFILVGWELVALAVMIAGIATAVAGAVALGVVIGAVGVVALFVVSMYLSAAGMFMRTILYRYATGKPVPELGLELSRTFDR
jgi:Family of unknown function (DUF6159)/Protein of unknown function (DUF2510)